mgnify:CR=1 FL=1
MRLLCEVMEVSRSGYYAYRGRRTRPSPRDEGPRLVDRVKAIHATTRGSYGTRRMAQELRAEGHAVGRYRARSLMRKAGVEVRRKRRFRATTDSRHSYPVASNRLERQFMVQRPDAAWVSDITYLWTAEGWLYLAVVIDLYSRRVVGWSLASHMRAELAMDALTMALWRRRPVPGLLHHSDRGSQYACHRYQDLLRDHGLVCSMSRKGDCWDNAVAERFFGSLKRECTDQRLYATREEARRDVVDYIEMFYNSRRRHSYLGYESPAAFEALPKAA